MPTNGGLIGKETHIKKVASNVTTTFNSSGILNSAGALKADLLIVAGGGGGGVSGGGAGGMRNLTSQTLPGGDLSITVGAGGTGIVSRQTSIPTGSSLGGNSSTIASPTATLYLATGGGGGANDNPGGGGGPGGDNGPAGGHGGDGGSGGGMSNTVTNGAGAGNQGGFSPVEGHDGGQVSNAAGTHGG